MKCINAIKYLEDAISEIGFEVRSNNDEKSIDHQRLKIKLDEIKKELNYLSDEN